MDSPPLVRLRGSAFSTMITPFLGCEEDASKDEDGDHQGRGDAPETEATVSQRLC